MVTDAKKSYPRSAIGKLEIQESCPNLSMSSKAGEDQCPMFEDSQAERVDSHFLCLIV